MLQVADDMQAAAKSAGGSLPTIVWQSRCIDFARLPGFERLNDLSITCNTHQNFELWIQRTIVTPTWLTRLPWLVWLTDLSLPIQLHLSCKNASLPLPLLLLAHGNCCVISWEISDLPSAL